MEYLSSSAARKVELNNFFSPHFVVEIMHSCWAPAFSEHPGTGLPGSEAAGCGPSVEIHGLVHTGSGEFENITHLAGDRYLLKYNIDGCTWLYEGRFDNERCRVTVEQVICGQGELSNGVLEAVEYDEGGDRFALSFSTAISPTQIYTVEGEDRKKVIRHTNERILGIPEAHLSAGEDASFTSFDGTLVSARLYLPSQALGYTGPARWFITSTAARRARSARISPGSRCL